MKDEDINKIIKIVGDSYDENIVDGKESFLKVIEYKLVGLACTQACDKIISSCDNVTKTCEHIETVCNEMKEENEVTHEVYFGENIKRIIKLFKKHKKNE
jgi:hypothetical protein